MSEIIKYKRMFLMLEQEDIGYGTEQIPSGYAKIEIRDGNGKMTISVQNLKEDTSKYAYQAYILRTDINKTDFAAIGEINLQKNKGEVIWNFNPNNIGMKGFSINDFSGVVIGIKFRNKSDASIICPLAWFRDKKMKWREKFLDSLLLEEKSKNAMNTENYLYDYESKKPYSDAAKAFPTVKNAQNEIEYIPNYEKTSSNYKLDQNDFPKAEDKDNTIEKNISNVPTNGQDLKTVECVYKNKKLCISDLKTAGSEACENCIMSKDTGNIEQTVNTADLEKLRESLNKCFETFNPFGSRRRDYSWWKINNPAFLNNILYQRNIKTALMFNPKVMMAHFKYKYIIFGIYSDRLKNSEYLVCGVPGVYNIDVVPFGDLCKWVQLEGNRPRYGAFGYWLIYLDPKNGKLLEIK